MPKRIYLQKGNFSTASVPGFTVLTNDDSGLKITTPSSTQPLEFTYNIGQYVASEGGVVFYRNQQDGVQLYLVVDIVSLGATSWSNVTSTEIGTQSKSLWNGASNSVAIISQPGHTRSAAKVCLDSVNGSKTDWYLPSKGEWELLWSNVGIVNEGLSSAGGQIFRQFNTPGFWTSTELSSTNAYAFNTTQGRTTTNIPSAILKTYSPHLVRAIRKFEI